MDVDTFKAKMRGSPRTKELYAENVNRYLQWLKEKKKQVSQESAQDYIDHLIALQKADNTIAVAANAIRKYFKVMRRTLQLEAPGVSISDPKYLSMPDFYRMVDACQTPLEKALIVTLFDTGARIGEIMNLELKDIDWQGGFVRVKRKGGRLEDVNISDKGMEALKEWLDSRKGKSNRVFGDRKYRDVRELLLGVAERAEVKKFTIHRIRHSRAVQMLAAECTLHDVQQALGHKSITTTANIYGRLRPADLKRRLQKAKW